MNKIKLFLVAAVILVMAGSAAAQKTGYIRVDDVVRLMPETSKIQTTLEKYQSDSLQPRFNYTLAEFQRKDSIVNGKDSLKTPAAARAKMREEMQSDLYELQNWQQLAQQLVQNKENQLLEPIYNKAIEAIRAVAKENGYAYVYTKDALLVAPPADDLLPLVAKKLNLTIPTGAPGARANTPATKQ
ncbi:MAG TPA: OmpH family outer membrane protein [Flavisolibacter sp.]|nr:OmpH family outer membrane protein [Flavisolibacter sp.]